ncbi:MAG: class F sortase, partial [Blastococcus sp.]
AALAAASRRGRVLAVVAAAVVSAAPSTSHSAASGHRTVTLSAASPAPAEAPVRLQVPTAGIDTPLTGIDLDAAGALVPPSDDADAGWYRSGPAPGEVGPAVLTGHVDSVAGPAVFFRLRDVAAGDPVTVTRSDGTTMRFTVTRVARFPKGAFPTGEVYAPTPRAELRLITCGGVFDRAAHSYLDNVVVYAQLS